MSDSDETSRAWATLEAAHEHEPPEDPRWAALSAGTLSADEAEVLRQRAPERFELYRPLSDAEQERITEGVLARLAYKERARRRSRIVAVVAALVALALGTWLGTR